MVKAVRQRVNPAAKKSPNIFSWEYFIQNHADIVTILLTLMVVGIMFHATQGIAFTFILMNHNFTRPESGDLALYKAGRLDLCSILFYFLVSIFLHALVQEYSIDKIVKRLKLSKYRTGQFTESTHLMLFFLASVSGIVYIMVDQEWFVSDKFENWQQQLYGVNEMPILEKFFFIAQISYWLHWYAALVLNKIKREEWPRRILYITLYLIFITLAYVFSYTRLAIILLLFHYLSELVFHVARVLYNLDIKSVSNKIFLVWDVEFLIIRVLSVALSILVLMKKSQQQQVDGSSSSATMDFVALALIIFINGWMLLNFLAWLFKRIQPMSPPTTWKSRATQKNKKIQLDSESDSAVQSGEESPKTSPKVARSPNAAQTARQRRK